MPRATGAELLEAGRLLDEDHQAEVKPHSPFCRRCPFYVATLGEQTVHTPMASGPEDVRKWLSREDTGTDG